MLVSSRYPEFWESLSGKAKMSLYILAYDWLLVVAGHVVPLDPVPVVVVEHGHAGLRLPVQLDLLPVIGLPAWWAKPGNRPTNNSCLPGSFKIIGETTHMKNTGLVGFLPNVDNIEFAPLVYNLIFLKIYNKKYI